MVLVSYDSMTILGPVGSGIVQLLKWQPMQQVQNDGNLEQLAFSEEVGVVVEVLISPGVKRNIIVVVMLKFQKHCDQGNTKA
jgi:hypothetical protein